MNLTSLLITQRTQQKLLLVFLTTGGILVYLWSVSVFYPIARGYGTMNWLLAIATGLIFITTYFIQKVASKSDKAIRMSARVFTALLIVLTLTSLFLMVIPYVASHSLTNFFYQDAYNDPSGYWPYLSGAVGDVLQSVVIFAFSPWTYHLVVVCLVVLAFNLLINQSAFTKLERRLHWSIFIFCSLFFLLWLVPWPWITYWIMD
jgi:hypothetical protein